MTKNMNMNYYLWFFVPVLTQFLTFNVACQIIFNLRKVTSSDWLAE